MSIVTTEQLGIAIRTRRRALKLTQGDLALACGTGQRFIGDLEKGKSTCHTGKMLSVLQALGLAIELAPTSGEGGTGDKK